MRSEPVILLPSSLLARQFAACPARTPVGPGRHVLKKAFFTGRKLSAEYSERQRGVRKANFRSQAEPDCEPTRCSVGLLHGLRTLWRGDSDGVGYTTGPECSERIDDIRQRNVPLAQGHVLEVGVGPGVNFAHYDPAKVNKIYALEPNRGMLRRAEEQRSRTQLQIEFIDLPGERIPLPDASVDTVVSTFALCTISGVEEAIRGIGRVLKPGGTLIFFEHGLSPDPRVRRWQARSGAALSLGIRRLSRDTRHSVSHRQEWLPYRTDGLTVPRSISEVGVVLLVGCGGSTT
jgi:SAM-dependent methyltransferase